jgi:hypothetical protein
VVALTGSTWNPVVAQLTVFEALKDAEGEHSGMVRVHGAPNPHMPEPPAPFAG